MRRSMIEVIDRIDMVDDSDRYNSLCIFAEGGPDARAMVCAGDEEGTFVCPQDPALSYVLMVQQAKECIDVWSEWRGGQQPTAQEKYAAVMFYSRHDAWLPVE